MKVKSLFDEKRRKAVREAIRKGENAFSKPSMTREAGGHDAGHMTVLGRKFGPVAVNFDPATFDVGKQRYDPTQFLLLAIQFGDVESANEAITLGADINMKAPYFVQPIHPSVSETDCSRTLVPGVTTPLEYAEKIGNPGMVALLKEKGAKE